MQFYVIRVTDIYGDVLKTPEGYRLEDVASTFADALPRARELREIACDVFPITEQWLVSFYDAEAPNVSLRPLTGISEVFTNYGEEPENA